MDELTPYRTLVKQHLSDFAAYANRSRPEGVETQCVFDEARDHYLLLSFGWSRGKRVRITLLHVRLKGGKVWVEEDDTEEGIAPALVRQGVPPGDIVLAFHPPQQRHLTDFAAA